MKVELPGEDQKDAWPFTQRISLDVHIKTAIQVVVFLMQQDDV